jgi:conjugal transfer mating pair stabilization protein TraN
MIRRFWLVLCMLSLSGAVPPAHAEHICAVDLNGNGDAADPGEVASCLGLPGGTWQCPLEQVACPRSAAGSYTCPLGQQYSCAAQTPGAAPTCSPVACIDTDQNPIQTEPVVDDPGALNDGAVDSQGNCLGNIQIFSGRALRCRPPGLLDTFQNCCADKGKIVKDGMGSSLASLSTKIAVAKNLFTGLKAAYTAYKAGATASAAANAGAHAIIVGIDPTSIAISLAINFMIETLLQGCDEQDMETGMLKGSGMCHEVGEYCASSVLGICIQKAKSQCCFNTKLGRIIQEQGRPQLKDFNAIGWGPVKHPDCRGLTAEEFQALDFSKMDLSEYYADVESKAQSDIQVDMKDKIDAYVQTINP